MTRSVVSRLWIAGPIRTNLVWGLTIASMVLICTLAAITAGDGPRAAALVGQAALVAVFALLAIFDLKAAAAVALLELVVASSGGIWTTFPGGIHGRLVLDAIVMVRAAATLVILWRRSGRLDLGRYGFHAVALSIVLPGVWMTLGVANGHSLHDVFSDGNATIFFAFVLVFVALIQSGEGPWLRRWLLVACAVNAIVYGLLVAISITRIVAFEPTLREILWDRLDMGNSFGFFPNGGYRLYLASGFFLQVGIAATAWELLGNWRRPVLWCLLALLMFDEVATYTRGFWIGAVLVFVILIVVGSRSIRQSMPLIAGTAILSAVVTIGGLFVGFSLPDYLTQRGATIAVAGALPSPSASPSATSSAAPSVTPTTPGIAAGDLSGEQSNAIRAEQARVLLGHIRERPIFGWGFGAVAPDYKYGSIPSYELAYLDLLFKTGIVGLLLWISWPARLLFDLVRARLGRLAGPAGLDPRAAALPIALIIGSLVTGATDPYLLASYGLLTILWPVAWLEPSPSWTAAGERPTTE